MGNFSLILKSGRERSVLRRHPWIFSGSVAEVSGSPTAGETVEVIGLDGQWLARGAFSPLSQIRTRIWTWDQEEAIDRHFFQRRIKQAIASREIYQRSSEVTAYREIYAESDGLPGIIVDRYRDYQVVQFLTAGGELWREVVLDCLEEFSPAEGIYERSDVDVRTLEGLDHSSGHLRGKETPKSFVMEENGIKFRIDIESGQKTGFFLDQRENRQAVCNWEQGERVLDAFCYSGGFGLSALRGGASHATFVDTSASALKLVQENIEINAIDPQRCSLVKADVFQHLRHLRDRDEKFQTIILDPPKFAPTAATADRASRGYKDINLLGFKLLAPGGALFTFSCSGGISSERFQKIVAGAALDAEVEAQVHAWFSQPPDHPMLLSFPESRYLKGLLCTIK